FFITLSVAIERALEISKRNDEAGPAVDESALENIMLEKRPEAMSERGSHRHALAGELGYAERGIAVHLLDDLFQIAEGELPDRVLQCAERLAVQQLIAFMYRLERVAHAALAEELRLAEIRIPAGTLDP